MSSDTPEAVLRARIAELEKLAERVLSSNIARGCKAPHPRITLIYDIERALRPPASA